MSSFCDYTARGLIRKPLNVLCFIPPPLSILLDRRRRSKSSLIDYPAIFTTITRTAIHRYKVAFICEYRCSRDRDASCTIVSEYSSLPAIPLELHHRYTTYNLSGTASNVAVAQPSVAPRAKYDHLHTLHRWLLSAHGKRRNEKMQMLCARLIKAAPPPSTRRRRRKIKLCLKSIERRGERER